MSGRKLLGIYSVNSLGSHRFREVSQLHVRLDISICAGKIERQPSFDQPTKSSRGAFDRTKVAPRLTAYLAHE